jgi:putative transposase
MRRSRPSSATFKLNLDTGLNINQACRKAGIGPTTNYRWKALQENPVLTEQFRILELESDIDRLKLLVAELALDCRMLQEA